MSKNRQAWNTIGLLPVSQFQTRLRSPTAVPDHTVQNQPGSDLGLADRLVLGQMDLGWKQTGVQQSSSLLLANTSEPIRTGLDRIGHVYWTDEQHSSNESAS